ncbi:TolC family protein [Desulforamulus ferrireducens]|uniref:Outer membrane efflux protein n=1 Tax=Desulforamulus ferrireducens TaxID=1833852 RepID=A0A1S6ITN7_9FIRM|nr:TolC family protein [Desulforamulus ferrireducens]AQS58143.1 hypothetical protein B0537_02960 [Desulforamulus ferrireducens]
MNNKVINKVLILLLAMFMVLGNSSVGYADAAVITIEQARALALENSRALQKHEINVKKAKYQKQQADRQLDDAIARYNSIGSKLGDDYSDSLLNQLDSQYDKVEAAFDSINATENNYDDAVKDEENYQQQLGYLVEEIYTSILMQEAALQKLNKEYELKQYLLTMERQKLALGSSSQYNVDELARGLTELNKSIIEQNHSIKTKKGQLNDMMGRGYDEELQLVPFEVKATLEIPEYESLLSDVTYSSVQLARIKRDLRELDDDYDDETDYYKSLILSQEIKAKELELAEQTVALYETVNNLLSQAKLKQEDYQIALNNYRNAQKTYEWAKKRYELGQISKLALLESEINYLNMQNQKNTAGYNLYLTQSILQLAAKGILNN